MRRGSLIVPGGGTTKETALVTSAKRLSEPRVSLSRRRTNVKGRGVALVGKPARRTRAHRNWTRGIQILGTDERPLASCQEE